MYTYKNLMLICPYPNIHIHACICLQQWTLSTVRALLCLHEPEGGMVYLFRLR